MKRLYHNLNGGNPPSKHRRIAATRQMAFIYVERTLRKFSINLRATTSISGSLSRNTILHNICRRQLHLCYFEVETSGDVGARIICLSCATREFALCVDCFVSILRSQARCSQMQSDRALHSRSARCPRACYPRGWLFGHPDPIWQASEKRALVEHFWDRSDFWRRLLGSCHQPANREARYLTRTLTLQTPRYQG